MLFKEIIGQEDIKQRLIKTVADNRVAHAQLFYGSEGHGKLSLALAYAQFISCRDTQKFTNQDSCGICPACIKYNKLIHPDLHFIYPVAEGKLLKAKQKATSKAYITQWREMLIENNYHVSLNDWYTKLDIERKQAGINARDCAEIISTLSYTSYESEYKIMLIWMIEKLNYQAAPKLLKILEEPPDKTLFILIAEQTDMVISTILSRLHLVKIPKIDTQSLMTACQHEFNLSTDQAFDLAYLANGSFKQAIKIQEQFQHREENFNRFVNWMRACYVPDVKSILSISEKLGKENREHAKNFLSFGIEALRNCVMIGIQQTELVRIIESERKFYTDFSPFVNTANIDEFNREFNQAIYHIERNVNGNMVFLDLSLTISRLMRIRETSTA
jgi:DNA polymerase-3 subunit delta'